MVLTATERDTLRAACAAISPPTDLPLVELIEAGLTDTPQHLRKQFRLLLGALGNPAVNLILAGRPQALSAMSDAQARAYGLRNLYVADGSVLPSAPAVNPMITIMAMAHRIAQLIP